jgi:predicted Zn finger-like uncharacterized protein
MFTECPTCQTIFRLTAEDLRRAQGKVRCGECHAVFNALESLAEEPAVAPPPVADTGRRLQPSWLIDSSDNPPGDLEPDLDAYEQTAYLPEDDGAFAYEFDEDEDDDGAILYIDDAQDTTAKAAAPAAPADPQPASAAVPAETAAWRLEPDDSDWQPEGDDTAATPVADDTEWLPETADTGWRPQADEPEWRLDADDGDADADADADYTDDFDAGLPEFDETIWERIPGVAAAEPPAESPVAGDAAPAAPEDGAVPPAAWEAAAAEPDLPEAATAEPATTAPASPPDPATEHAQALAVWVAEGGSTSAAPPAEVWPDAGAAESGAAAAPDTSAQADAPPADPADDPLEFDVPAENWNQFFGPVAAAPQPIVWEPPAPEPAAADAAAAAADAPSWQGEDSPAGTGGGRTGLRLTGALLLLVLFAGQLLHYNRDQLAAHPEYGAWVRDAYAALNQPLYPAWPLLNNYEIRGSEAVVGESGPDVMDIRAQIAAVGKHPTGLPRLRVVLRDRWSNPVAASDFGPEQYAAPADLPAGGLLRPGDVVPARVSIADPGAGVQGFELELCLPRRNTGLECTDQPFK